jgi:hypothetical protein
MARLARCVAVAVAATILSSSPARADFCSNLARVAEVANADNLASLGVGPSYTGPAIAGHEGEFPSDDTQNTSQTLDGALRCGVNTLTRPFYSCDLPGGLEAWRSTISQCFGSISFQGNSDGVTAQLGGAKLSLAAFDPGVTRIDVSKWPEDTEDWTDE